MKRKLIQLVPNGVRYMTQPTDGTGSAVDTGAGKSPEAPTGDTGGHQEAPESGSGASRPSEDSQATEDTTESRKKDISSFPEEAQALIRSLRKENGDYRAAKKAAEEQAAGAGDSAKNELIQSIGKALGLVDDEGGDKTPSADELTKLISDEQEAHRATKVELAVYRIASKHEADPDALLDSRSFLAEATKLDPTADDFGDKIAEAVKSAVERNPKLKQSGQTPARSGGQVSGGGAVAEGTPESLAARIRKNRNY